MSQPLLFHVWDTGDGPQTSRSQSHHQSIGLVYIDLNPLLMQTANLDGGEDESNVEGKGERKGSVGASGDMSFNAGLSGGGSSSGGGKGGNDVSPGVIDGWFQALVRPIKPISLSEF